MFETLFHRQMTDLGMERPHVIAVREAEVFFKAILLREKLAMVSQMPLSETGGGVPFLLADFSQSYLICMDAVC
jgi:hypothetical protein